MAVSEEQNQQETTPSVDENELEQYGVWVKAGPEDVIEAEAEDEAFALDDLSDELLAEEPEAEPGALDTAELAISGDGVLGGDDDDVVELTLDDLSTDDEAVDELPDSLDLDLSDDFAGESVSEDDASGLLTIEDDDLTIDLGDEVEELGAELTEDLISEPEAIAAEPVDGLDDLESLEEPEEIDLADLEAEPHPAPAEATDIDTPSLGGGVVDDDLNIDEDLPDDLDDLKLDLDNLDVDAFEEPTTGSPEEPEAVLTLQDEPLETIEEPALLDIEEEVASETEAELESLESLDFADEPEDLDLSTLGDEELTLDQELQAAAPVDAEEPDDIVDLSDLPDAEDLLDIAQDPEIADVDLADVADVEIPLVVEPAAKADEVSSDRSLSLLENIERELTSIRTELGDLKRELGELRSVPAPSEPAEPTGDDEAGGFFDESEDDDDETIALSATELDNIMNTAEFTEETGEAADIEDLLPNVEEPEAEELAIDLDALDDGDAPVTEIILEEADEETEPLELDLDATESEALSGSEDEVEVLASMDIDAELADIEELEDLSESADETSEGPVADLSDIDEPIDTIDPTALEDELVLDTEPLEEIDLAEEPGFAEPVEDLVPETFPELEPEAVLTPEPAVRPESDTTLPDNLQGELRSVLSYMDQLLESLPEEKIQEFAKSEHFTVYRRLFEVLGLEQQ